MIGGGARVLEKTTFTENVYRKEETNMHIHKKNPRCAFSLAIPQSKGRQVKKRVKELSHIEPLYTTYL